MSTTTEQSVNKPKLGFWDIWNMSFGFMGIQMGFGLQIGNTSRIFQTLGAGVEDLAIYWLAGPVTGLIVQPIIGYLSDRTWHPKWGRRRPYFFIGAVLAAIALVMMPNSPGLWMAIGMLWIMDSSFNVAMEPFRAFVGDKLPTEQRTTGFAMQSFFIGVGAVLASLLPSILTSLNFANTAAPGVIPDSVRWSFYIGALAFFLAVVYTVFTTTEYPPEQMEAFEDPSEADGFESILESAQDFAKNASKQFLIGGVLGGVGLVSTFWVLLQGLSRDLYVLAIGLLLAGILFFISGFLQKEGHFKNAFVTVLNDLQFMPKTMRQLAVVQFFSWFALFAMWIYCTPAVAEFIFGSNDPTSVAYNDGANYVSNGFAVYNGVAALVAFLLPIIAGATSRKFTHFVCLVAGGIGLMSIYFVQTKMSFIVGMIGVGIAWSSILSMPYAILTGSLPSKKMGYYMGVFNFFIVIPQIVAASILGFILSSFFEEKSICALLIGGISFIIAGVSCMMVNDVDETKKA